MNRSGDEHIAGMSASGKRFVQLAIMVLCMLGLSCGIANAQGGGGKPIRVQKILQPLEYALVGSSAASGTVTIDSATGTKVAGGGAVNLGGIHTRALFEINGEKNRSFSIMLPGSITITAPGGATTTITGFESTPAFTGTLDNQGKAQVYVGAVLQVAAGQTTGTYTSIFDITVDYVP
jgi:hypothetical protein